MCNFLERDGIKVHPIPTTGFGWKLKRKRTKGFVPPIRRNHYQYTFDKDGWCHWDMVKNWADGFCFFIDKEEAERAAKMWGANLEACKIEYAKGLGTRKEHHFIARKSFNVALCKSFRWVRGE